MKKAGLKSTTIFAERIAVEAAYEYYTNLGYKCIYKAKHGVKGPDLIFVTNTQPKEYLILEAKGALENSKFPSVGKNRLFSNIYDQEKKEKVRLAQLSSKWLLTNSKRYLNSVKEGMEELLGDELGEKEFLEFRKFLASGSKYRASLFYASPNEKIRWNGGFEEYFRVILEDENISSFEMVKAPLGNIRKTNSF